MVTWASSPTHETIETLTPVPVVKPQASRLISIDILRGLVMVLMALDHTRDFMWNGRFAPEDLAHTNGALFFTRFITHYCAPVFAFLAGTGAYLSTRRGKSLRQVSWFFLTRGLWLVFLELTIVSFAWGFVPWAHGGVIWILGWSMVAMAAIVWLPVGWIAALGLGMIATHNLLDSINPASFGKLYWVWILLHTPGDIPITQNFSFSVRYTLIPWVGVMTVGFAFGRILERRDRRKTILTLGIVATVVFFALRAINFYGNGIAGLPFGFPSSAGPWSVQPTLALTLVSFFNVLKYPPSLDYLLITLGPALILVGLLDGAQEKRGLSRILMVFGRVPLFYYLMHLYLLHVLAILASLALRQPVWHGGSVIDHHVMKPLGYGHGLPFVYAMWIVAVTLLYFPCRWFMEFRGRHREWAWLSYL